MTQEIVTPDQFEAMITDSLAETQPEPTEETETEEETEEAAAADKEALGETETETETEDAQGEGEPEPEEDKGEKEEEAEADLFDVKVDGEKQKVSKEELVKSYERFAASTQRFQEASKLKKEADAATAKAEKIEQNAKQIFNRLLSDPQAILDVIGGNSPETLHRAFEVYAKRHVADEELKEKDRDLYDATLAQRRREAEIKRQQQELARQKEELERTNSQAQQEREQASVQKTFGIYNETAPKALKAAGVPDKMLKSVTLQNALRGIVQSTWPEGLSLTDLPQHINNCAKELVDDPAIKAMLGKVEPEPKKETKKPKATVTVTSPEAGPSKSKFMTPNAFLKSIMG